MSFAHPRIRARRAVSALLFAAAAIGVGVLSQLVRPGPEATRIIAAAVPAGAIPAGPIIAVSAK